MNLRQQKHKWGICGALIGLCSLAAIGGTMAYFTDYEETTNKFTVGKIQIELTEPKWKPEEHTRIIPRQEIPKDPQITNTGLNEAFVYLEVSVPVRNVLTAYPDGTKKEKTETELFTYSVNQQWTKLSEAYEQDYKTYTYVYNHILNPEKTTEPLFEAVTFVNLVEGQLEDQELSIPIRAFAIQSDYTGDDHETVLSQAEAAYEKFVRQNPEIIRQPLSAPQTDETGEDDHV